MVLIKGIKLIIILNARSLFTAGKNTGSFRMVDSSEKVTIMWSFLFPNIEDNCNCSKNILGKLP